jgi:hypothetical protein
MKRFLFLFLLLAPLAGCAEFDDFGGNPQPVRQCGAIAPACLPQQTVEPPR